MTAWLYHVLIDPLTPVAHQHALIGGSWIAVVCGVIGCFIVLRRMAFLTDALSHSMLAGVVTAYLFLRIVLQTNDVHGPALLLGAMIAGLVTVATVGFVSRVSRIKEDTAIGIMYTGIFAAGAVLASVYRHLIHIDLYHFVTGEVIGISDVDLWTMAIIAAFVLSIVILFYRQLQLVSFDRVMAASIGVSVVLFDYLLTTCTSFVVIGAVNMVGVIQVVGLMVTPAATAYLVSDRLNRMMVLAAVFGVTSVIGGIYLMSWTGNFPPGGSIVVVSTLQFLVVLFVAPRYGLIADWLRRARLVPEAVIEDVVGAIERQKQQPVPLVTINRFVEAPASQVQRAIQTLKRRDWIDAKNGGFALTERGKHEARRLKRAHRLWETYLNHVGVAGRDLHARAHHLEHLHDEEAVDYLDDKLGHPLKDPHGSRIPEDFVHLVPGQEVASSLLRRGHRAVVTKVGDAALASPLVPDMEIVGGPRRDDAATWTFILPDGRRIELDHAAADAVKVRLIDVGRGKDNSETLGERGT
jgi:ABC-type Mn2+/Zn2+ transport system permease subunit/Mn-dependent DtxR family transcriptional regulator